MREAEHDHGWTPREVRRYSATVLRWAVELTAAVAMAVSANTDTWQGSALYVFAMVAAAILMFDLAESSR